MRFLGLILFMLCFFPEYGHSNDNTEIELLLSRLKLEGEGLAQAKLSADNPEDAATALLEYYRKSNPRNQPG